MKREGSWDTWNTNRGNKVSKGLLKFWETASQEYIDQREIKKQKSRDLWTDEDKLKYHNKMSESAIRDRANTSPEEYHRRSILATETKKKNGTFGTSINEDITYKLLCEKFGEDDIVFDNYIDDRYSTKCDFYIKSLDIFIELNIFPSHGDHPFNKNNKQDLALMEKLKNNNDDWSNMILDAWGNRDIKKFEQAKRNKLNYIAVYNNEFENFIKCIEEDNLWSLVNQK